MWGGIDKTAGRDRRECKNELQYGKGVYVSMKIKDIIAKGWAIFIDYVASIAFVIAERAEAPFCLDFFAIFYKEKMAKKRKKNNVISLKT